jgi:hypothetical protein
MMLAAIISAGCAVADRVAPGRGAVEEPVSAITYELTAAGTAPLLGGLFESAPGPTALRPAHHDAAEPADEPAPDAETTAVLRGPRLCRLEVRRFGTTARGRLALYREPDGAATRRPVEAYQLDLAAAEIPLILDDLDASGFFGGQQRLDGGASITLRRGETADARRGRPSRGSTTSPSASTGKAGGWRRPP